MRHHLATVLGLVASTSLVACSGGDTGKGTQNVTGNDGGGTGGSSNYVPPTGAPVSAPDGTWTWVPVDGAKCRDGSQAGFAVNMNSSTDKVMIFLEGGGACYNQATCGANPSTYNPSGVSTINGGLLDRAAAANPVKDWNMVYVPFCTGDVHAGSAEDVTVPGVAAKQQFVGYKNMELFLDRIVPTFPKPSQVLHTGISAGGFGAALTAQLVSRKFPPGTNITLIDDSGPPMNDTVLPPCLQGGWKDTWGFENTFLKDCGADCPDHTNYSIDWSFHLTKLFPKAKGGLIETTDDSVITLFYGFGTNNCAASPASFPPPVPEADFKAGLLDFRSQVQAKNITNFGTYFITGTQHTWLHDSASFAKDVGGVKLVDWLTNILNGTSADQVGP